KIVSLTDYRTKPIFRGVNMSRTGVSIVRNIHPKAQFVKDGKIHAFLNVDDELGYVRIKVN
ncbi:hypothetical protein SAMN06295967_109174, partial [Belliella buryatensis]